MVGVSHVLNFFTNSLRNTDYSTIDEKNIRQVIQFLLQQEDGHK